MAVIEDPQEVQRQVCAFLGLPSPDHEFIESIHIDSTGVTAVIDEKDANGRPHMVNDRIAQRTVTNVWGKRVDEKGSSKDT